MFRGREKEIAILKKQFSQDKRTAVLVYGKRRIGKTTLILEASKTFDGVVVCHTCVKSSYEGNLDLLARSICIGLGCPVIGFATIFDLFDFVRMQNKNILVSIDEYQYFRQSKSGDEVDSFMQVVVDALPANVKLVLCGSYISVMKELLLESNPLFGRFSSVIGLEEFDYKDSSLFYPSVPIRKKIELYSVFGGSPFVLENLEVDESIESNVEKLLLEPNSILRTHIESVMLKEIQKGFDTRILMIIGNGKKRYSDIAKGLGGVDNGLLDKQLKSLVSMETLEKNFPINKNHDKKKQFYELSDNLMRFYFTYIWGNDSLIARLGSHGFYEMYIKDSLTTFVSFRFERIVNQFFSRCVKEGTLKEVLDIGSFWYDDKETKTNGQFDCVLKTLSGYNVYECKFLSSPMILKDCEKEASQISLVKGIEFARVGFVSSSGFDFESSTFDLINGEELYW